MNRNKKRRTSVGIAAALVLSVCAPGGSLPVYADAVKVVTLGADLSEEQKANILQFFGVEESQVYTITITNQDEHEKLGLLIPSEQIGTHTFSCAMVSPTTQGGIQVKTANMNYVTSNMIASTLSTSGVINCDVLTAAPFEVSGTGALTGTMMAYETASGETLDEEKKQLANEELVTTEDLADTVGQEEATLVVNDIKIHIIRDQLKEEEEVKGAVDQVVTDTQAAMEKRAANGGAPVAGTISDEQKNSLYGFGYKVSQQNYNYDEMKVTLQRVTENVSVIADIDDPIMETFEDLTDESQLASDSILRETDDEALGDDSNVNATDISSFSHEYAEPVSTSSVNIVPGAVVPSGSANTLMPLLTGQKDGLTAFLDMQGNPVTDYRFDPDSVAVLNSGTFIMAKDASSGYYGVLNSDGTELIPFRYSLCSNDETSFYMSETESRYESTDQHWLFGYMLEDGNETDYDLYYHSSYYKIQSADLYFIDEGSAEKVAELSRDQLTYWYSLGRYITIRDRNTDTYTIYDETFQKAAEGLGDYYENGGVAGANASYMGYQVIKKNGQQVLADKDGNVILETGYSQISQVAPDTVLVSDGEKYGLVDYDGNVVLPCLFRSINRNSYGNLDHTTGKSTYTETGYYAVENENGTLCFAVKGGGISFDTGIPYTRTDVSLTISCDSACYEDEQGKWHLFAADGVTTDLSSDYFRCTPVQNTAGRLYLCQNNAYDYELLDWHGEVIWTGVDSVKVVDSFLTINANSELHVYELGYTEVPEMEAVDDGIRAVNTLEAAEEGSSVSEINLTMTAEYENAEFLNDTNNLMFRDSDSQKIALADINGDLISDYEYEYSNLRGKFGLISVSAENGYSILNQENEILTEDFYDEIQIFSSSWFVGYQLEEISGDTEDADFESLTGNGSWNIVNADLYHLKEDLSAVKVKSLTREEFGNYKELTSEHMAVMNRTSGLWTVYDGDGNILGDGYTDTYDASIQVEPQQYRENGRTGLMDTDGNILIPPSYSYIDSVSLEEGYAVVNDGEKKGIVDFEGHLILPVEFDRIERNGYYENMYNNLGYFLVEKDGTYAYVRQGGEVTCQTKYSRDDYNASSHGAAMVYKHDDGSYTLTSADGVVTEIEEVDYLQSLKGCYGMLFTYQEEDYTKNTLIDWHGNVLFQNYKSFDITEDGNYLLAMNEDNILEMYTIEYAGLE